MNKYIHPALAVTALAATTLAAAAPGDHAAGQALAGPLLRPINPPQSMIPGISQAVIVEGGRTMYLSGHVPMAQDGKVPQGLQAQLEQVFENLDATLRAAGATSRNLARITIYVRNFHAGQLPAIRSARDRFIDPRQPPASALIGVADLFHPDVLVEVDAVAVLPAGG